MVLVPPEPVLGLLAQAHLTPLTKHRSDRSALSWGPVLLASEHFSHGLITGNGSTVVTSRGERPF